MKNKNNISFLKRLKIAIFNLDEYGIFIEEKLGVAIRYILLITFFTSIVLGIISTTSISKEFRKGLDYFENDFPDFSFEGTKLRLNEIVYGFDEEYNVKLIADSSDDMSTDKINEYMSNNKDTDTFILVLKDKIIYRNYDLKTEYSYDNLNSVIKLKDSSKQDILNEFNSLGGYNSILVSGFIASALALFIESIIEILLYAILVAIVGLIVGRMCGIIMRTSVAGTLAIYSLTVSVLCSFIYSIVYNYTGFEIKNFDVMYLIIAYIYMIAAILIIKTDLMKQTAELMRIKSTEEQVRDELKRRELEEKEKQEKQEKNDDSDEKKEEQEKNDSPAEPDGSEI